MLQRLEKGVLRQFIDPPRTSADPGKDVKGWRYVRTLLHLSCLHLRLTERTAQASATSSGRLSSAPSCTEDRLAASECVIPLKPDALFSDPPDPSPQTALDDTSSSRRASQ